MWKAGSPLVLAKIFTLSRELPVAWLARPQWFPTVPPFGLESWVALMIQAPALV